MLSGGMDMFNSFMHPEKGYHEAGKQVQQGWDQARGYEEPYWQNGVNQHGKLVDAEGKLLNPVDLQNEWSQGYEQSPYAKQLLEQNRTSGLDAASSMGLMGSSAALGNIQVGAGNIVSKDRQQYMNDLMQKYMTGIGIGQDIYGKGANAGANLGRGALQTGEDLGQTKFGEENAPGERFSQILKMAMQAAGYGGMM